MELEHLSGFQLGDKVRSKEISPVEVIDYFAERIEERNPSINAFVYTNFDEARQEAKLLEQQIMDGYDVGPFAGVPVGLKDFLPAKKGWPETHGGVKCLQTTDIEDNEFYKAAKTLGAIAIGKTNAPSFGFRGTTDNKMFGPTSTPFKVGYNSGGSSGGSAAAVADGLVPIASAGDAGGSTRIPAAWCGCFGFKPSAGIIPSVCRPDAWTATHPYCCGSHITRTVDDSAYLLNQMISYNPRDPISVRTNLDLVAATSRSVHTLKIGYTFDFNLFPMPDDEIVQTMIEAIKMLPRYVTKVEHVDFNIRSSRSAVEGAWLRGISIDDAVTPHVVEAVEQHPEDVPEEFLRWHKLAKESTMQDYRRFHEIRTEILDAHLDVFDDYDIILAPVTGCLPVKNTDDGNTKGPKQISGENVDELIGFGYTYLENLIGTPAASVPIGVSKSGLPIGLQVIGRRYEDAVVMSVCSALEKILPWNYHIPFNRTID